MNDPSGDMKNVDGAIAERVPESSAGTEMQE
jgi:hypothetical protein